MTTVAISSAQPILARGLAAILAHDFAVEGLFSSIEALCEYVGTAHPKVVIVEALPSVSLAILSRIAGIVGQTRVIMWVEAASSEFAARCFSAGVAGDISKFASEDDCISCVRDVVRGSVWIDKTLQIDLLGSRYVRLTNREQQIVFLLAQGLRNKEIAHSLGVSEGTIKVYLSRLFHKAGVSDRFELALLALRNFAANTVVDAPAQQASVSSLPSGVFGDVIWVPRRPFPANAVTVPGGL